MHEVSHLTAAQMAVVLAAVGILSLALAITFAAGVRGRSIRTALLLVVISALLIVVGWFQGSLPSSRACILVFDEFVDIEVLRASIDEFGPYDRLVLLRVDHQAATAPVQSNDLALQIPQPADSWKWSEACKASAGRASTTAEIDVAVPLRVAHATDIRKLFRAAQHLHQCHWTLLPYRNSTLIFVAGSEGGSFGGFSLPTAESSTDRLFGLFVDPRNSLFVLSGVQANTGALILRMPQSNLEIASGLTWNSLDQITIDANLQGRSDLPGDTDIECVLSINGVQLNTAIKKRARDHTFSVFLKELTDLEPESAEAAKEGIHRLTVQVSWPRADGTEPESFSSSVYFRVRHRSLLVIEDKISNASSSSTFGLEELLPTRTFPVSDTLKRFSLVDAASPRADQPQRQATLGTVHSVEWSDCKKAADEVDQPFGKEFQEHLKHHSALVLVHPGVEDLKNLAKIGVEKNINNGLSVAIVGMPVDDGALPTWAKGFAKRGATSFARDDLTVYFCPDNSFVSQLFSDPVRASSDNTTHITGVDYQVHTANEFFTRVDAKTIDGGAFRNPWKLTDELFVKPRVLEMAYSEKLLGKPLLSICPIPGIPDFYKNGAGDQIVLQRGVRLELAGQDGTDNLLRFSYDLALSAISPRLEKLFDESDVASFRPLARDSTHNRTVVVLFVPAINGDKVYLSPPPLPIAGQDYQVPASNPAATIETLQEIGVRFILVKVKPNSSILDTYDGAAGLVELADIHDNDPNKWKELVLDCSEPSSPKTVASAIMKQIEAWAEPLKIEYADTLGRVIDDRTSAEMAPWKRYLVDENPDRSRVFAYTNVDGKKLPLIESRLIGEGRITVLHYSPVSFDTLRDDATFPRELVRGSVGAGGDFIARAGQTSPELRGLGIQRFLDLTELNRAGEVRANEPVLSAVQETPAGDALLFQCWLVLAKDKTSFQNPVLVTRDSPPKEFPCAISSIDSMSRNITFKLQATNEPIQVDGADLLLGTEKVPIHCPLTLQPSAFGSTLLDFLRSVSSFTGGGELRRADEINHSLPRHLGHTWVIAAVCIPLLSLLLLSPICRSWNGLYVFIGKIWAAKPADDYPPEMKAVVTEVEGVMTKWGRHAGMPDAQRHAGEKVGQRVFQSGDALAVCRPEGLIPFTSVNEGLDLPARNPTVRLRHASRTMHAWIMPDVGPNLRLPVTSEVRKRTDYLVKLCSIVARATWLQAGSVSVATPQHPERVFGPAYNVDSAPQLTEFLFECARQDASDSQLTIPSSCDSGQAVYLVSGLIGFSEAAIKQFMLQCVVAGVSLRLIQLVDTQVFRMSGLCFNDAIGTFSDRNDWSEQYLRQLYQALANDLRNQASRSDFRFQCVFTERSISDTAAELFSKDFFK
ncbi:MAG: hypothetical protein SFV81_28855 [Pirellulaceae bacterium]|nr:hypothetical protein [Pirellulaceae bacterium]